MRIQWPWPIAVACVIIASYELGTHHRTNQANPTAPNKDAVSSPDPKPETKESDEYLGQVKIVGPLANWMTEAEENEDSQIQQHTSAPDYTASELDRVTRRPAAAPDNFLHTTFPVKTYTAFEILLPPGLVSASLSGSFESFSYTAQRQPADIEVLLMDNLQFSDFVHRNAGSASYSLEPCSRQSLKWLLNSDYHKTK